MTRTIMNNGPRTGNDKVLAAPTTSPSFDPAEYADDMAEFGLSAAQEAEFLAALWNITGAFARMGMKVDVCGLIFADFNDAAAPESVDGMLEHSTSMETPSTTGDKEDS